MAPQKTRGTTRDAGTTRELDVDALLADRGIRILVCCGAGGVGKTTTAAAIALRAAESGRRAVVLTIDPARRLAQSLGLTELDNIPRPVVGLDPAAGGSLDAMMLDMKRTFDEVVEQHATPEKAEQILANPFYVAVSSSFAGTQEYMAMEKLGQLRQQSDADDRWDLIVVDTPPSRSALDFLDAPKRLGTFLDGRFIRLLMAPAKAGGKAYMKALTAGMSLTVGVMTKLLGGDLLRDAQTFVAALDTMFGGFRQRADQTYALLQNPETAFLVVAAPQRDALREAAFFVERLAVESMPLAGVVINRVQGVEGGLTRGRAEDAAAALADEPERATTAALLRLHADLATIADAHRGHIARFTTGHPGIPLIEVPAAATDIHDLDGLRAVGAALSDRPRSAAAAGVGA